jgi:hypothetical protein
MSSKHGILEKNKFHISIFQKVLKYLHLDCKIYSSSHLL